MAIDRKTADEFGLIMEQQIFLKTPKHQRASTVVCDLTSLKVRKNVSPYHNQSSTVSIDPFMGSEIKERPLQCYRDFVNKRSDNLALDEGFPIPFVYDEHLVKNNIDEGRKRKSIFGWEMERRVGISPMQSYIPEERSNLPANHGLEYLKQTGPRLVSGYGLGIQSTERERIHSENIERLSHLTEDEIMQERELLLRSTDASIISFFLHKSRHSTESGNNRKPPSTTKTEFERLSGVDIDPTEKDKLAWTGDLPPIAKNPPSIVSQISDPNSANIADPQRLTDCSTPPHQLQARFDFRGLIIPPDSDVDTHLGLHHHGEEPERAGYTISELFHLCRSSMPNQRRLALAILASSLAQSRFGRHITQLAPRTCPSLIYGLMSSLSNSSSLHSEGTGGKGGVGFLLRWCLDESVSAVTSVGSTVSSEGQGTSIGLIIECIRGLANLLCDSYGEAVLAKHSELFRTMETMAHLWLSPSDVKSKSAGQDSDPDDHSIAMSHDPVAFLFNQTTLGQRLAWLLSGDRMTATLPPDVAGLWLPALLLRAVRHSPSLAYRIFRIPNLFDALINQYLPEVATATSTHVRKNRPDRLYKSDNIPLPGILQLCRITMETSSSISIRLINDFGLINRCCSYLIMPRSNDNPDLDIIISHLPPTMPTQLCVRLQLEALRTLCSCLSTLTDNSCGVQQLWNHFEDLSSAYHMVFLAYKNTFIQHSSRTMNNVHYSLVSLLTNWLSFESTHISFLSGSSGSSSLYTAKSVEQHTMNSYETIEQLLLHLKDSFESAPVAWVELKPFLERCGITPQLIFATVSGTTSLLSSLHRVNSKQPFQIRLVRIWEQILLPLLSSQAYRRCTEHFRCCQSILTGSPELLGDLDPIHSPPSMPTIDTESTNPLSQRDYEHPPANTPVDITQLSPVSLSADCLPDFGARVCFHYFEPHSDAPTAFVWPRLNIPIEDDGDTLSDDPRWGYELGFLWTIVHLFELLISIWRLHLFIDLNIECLRSLITWIQSVAFKPIFPWNRSADGNNDNHIPHTLAAMETDVLGRALIMVAKVITHDCSLALCLKDEFRVEDGRLDVLYLAALRLLPLLRGNQFGLKDQLMDEILFSPLHLKLFEFPLHSEPSLQDANHMVEQLKITYDRFLTPQSDDSNSFGTTHLATIHESYQQTENHVSTRSSTNRLTRSIVQPVVPTDVVYAPLIGWFTRSVESEQAGKVNEVDEKEQHVRLMDLTNGLYWLWSLTQNSESHLPLGPTSLTQLASLCMGFLACSRAGSLGFGLAGHLTCKLIHSLGSLSKIQRSLPNLNISLEGIDLPQLVPSFYDLYVNLINHFTALSYNSPVFANLILWPCQQACHMKYRRALWGEHQSALHAIRLRPDQLLLPITSFLEPEEAEDSVLRLYASAIFSRSVHVSRQPVLYLIAVHHINRYLFNQQNRHKEFTQHFTKFIRASRQVGDVGGTRAPADRKRLNLDSVLQILYTYKQPKWTCWTREKVELNPALPYNLGVDDVLTIVVEADAHINDYLELYAPDEIPQHRKLYWTGLFG